MTILAVGTFTGREHSPDQLQAEARWRVQKHPRPPFRLNLENGSRVPS
jgi:hypothetical protein